MSILDRRQFLAASLATSVLATSDRAVAGEKSGRKFTLDLRAGSVGVTGNLREQIDLAAKHGFESVGGDTYFLSSLSDAENEALLGHMNDIHVVWGGCSLPVDFRKDESKFRANLKALPARAAAAKRAGITRMGTWIMPCHDELTYLQNFRQHAARLGECVRVLNDHGLRFGMEYVGTQSLRVSKRYPFLHTLKETGDLIDAIGGNDVGYILDSWHWFTAGETVEDLKSITNADIVACDLNDAPAGLALDEQIDTQRELPMATGVIDIAAFLGALVELGYDGPIRAEPFNKKLNAMDNDAACAATASAMKAAFDTVG